MMRFVTVPGFELYTNVLLTTHACLFSLTHGKGSKSHAYPLAIVSLSATPLPAPQRSDEIAVFERMRDATTRARR